MFELVAIGTSAGGLNALKKIIPKLPGKICYAVIVVQHIHEDADNYIVEFLNKKSAVLVKEADEKEIIEPGTVYIAPPGYHLLVEADKTFSLSVDPPVNFSRPSIDVLFNSAAEVYSDKMIGVILTGANADGAKGLRTIKQSGGLSIVQQPEEAESKMMPQSAISETSVDHIFSLEEIAEFLCKM